MVCPDLEGEARERAAACLSIAWKFQRGSFNVRTRNAYLPGCNCLSLVPSCDGFVLGVGCQGHSFSLVPFYSHISSDPLFKNDSYQLNGRICSTIQSAILEREVQIVTDPSVPLFACLEENPQVRAEILLGHMRDTGLMHEEECLLCRSILPFFLRRLLFSRSSPNVYPHLLHTYGAETVAKSLSILCSLLVICLPRLASNPDLPASLLTGAGVLSFVNVRIAHSVLSISVEESSADCAHARSETTHGGPSWPYAGYLSPSSLSILTTMLNGLHSLPPRPPSERI